MIELFFNINSGSMYAYREYRERKYQSFVWRSKWISNFFAATGQQSCRNRRNIKFFLHRLLSYFSNISSKYFKFFYSFKIKKIEAVFL